MFRNISSFRTCISSIIYSASISNHPMRQISNRHAINNTSMRSPTKMNILTQTSRYIPCTTSQNVSPWHWESKRTNNATFAIPSSEDGGCGQSKAYLPTIRPEGLRKKYISTNSSGHLACRPTDLAQKSTKNVGLQYFVSKAVFIQLRQI